MTINNPAYFLQFLCSSKFKLLNKYIRIYFHTPSGKKSPTFHPLLPPLSFRLASPNNHHIDASALSPSPYHTLTMLREESEPFPQLANSAALTQRIARALFPRAVIRAVNALEHPCGRSKVQLSREMHRKRVHARSSSRRLCIYIYVCVRTYMCVLSKRAPERCVPD